MGFGSPSLPCSCIVSIPNIGTPLQLSKDNDIFQEPPSPTKIVSVRQLVAQFRRYQGFGIHQLSTAIQLLTSISPHIVDQFKPCTLQTAWITARQPKELELRFVSPRRDPKWTTQPQLHQPTCPQNVKVKRLRSKLSPTEIRLWYQRLQARLNLQYHRITYVWAVDMA